MRITFESLWAEFRHVEQRAVHRFKNELRLVGQQLDAVATVFDVIHERFTEDENLRIMWFYHIGKTLTSFEGAVSHTLRGLFSESANDIRVGMETLWQLLYLHDNANERVKWFNDSRISAADVRKKLSVADVRRQIYDEFCAVAHPRKKAMDWYYTYMEGHMRFGPTFELGYAENHLQNINRFLGWIQEDLIYRLYPDAFGSPLSDSPPELIQKYVSNTGAYKAIYHSSLDVQGGIEEKEI